MLCARARLCTCILFTLRSYTHHITKRLVCASLIFSLEILSDYAKKKCIKNVGIHGIQIVSSFGYFLDTPINRVLMVFLEGGYTDTFWIPSDFRGILFARKIEHLKGGFPARGAKFFPHSTRKLLQRSYRFTGQLHVRCVRVF